MRKFLIAIAAIAIIPSLIYAADTVSAGTLGKSVQFTTISTTGTHKVEFTKQACEIYIVNLSTATAYIHWTSSHAVTTGSFQLTGGSSRTESIDSKWMSILQTVLPVSLRIQIKSLR